MTAILTALWIILTAQAERADRPNVIVIMADDIGAEGLACYGSTIYTTPHLDRMAAEGLRFENAYATPLCTPTRGAFMSGRMPVRLGMYVRYLLPPRIMGKLWEKYGKSMGKLWGNYGQIMGP